MFFSEKLLNISNKFNVKWEQRLSKGNQYEMDDESQANRNYEPIDYLTLMQFDDC